MFLYARRLALTTSILCFLPLAALADSASAPVTHGELSEAVKKVLLDNPEIIMEAAQKLHEKQLASTQKDAKAGMEKNHAELFDDVASPSIGNKKADVTVIEFFDYHCGYCHQVLPTMVKLSENDPKVRIVFKEFPILSEDSVQAARAALAVNMIDKSKYFDFHKELMSHTGKFDQASLEAMAEKVGIDGKKLTETMQKQEITDMLAKNHKLAESMGIRGTPALIVGDQLLPGALPYDDLKKIVDDTRNGKKPATAVD